MANDKAKKKAAKKAARLLLRLTNSKPKLLEYVSFQAC
jgi:hypothetical protein